MEKEKSDNSGNVETKPAWNKSSNDNSGIKPVMGASSWPALSETTTTKDLSNKSDGSSSSSVSISQQADLVVELNYIQQRRYMKQSDASASTNGIVAAQQPSRQSSSGFPEFPLSYTFPRGQNQRKNQNGNHRHQSHGNRPNQENGNQNWNLHRNFNGRGGFVQSPSTPGFVRPTPHMLSPIHAQFMLPHPIYPFGGHMVFPELAPPPQMYYLQRMPFTEPPLFYNQSQEIHLDMRIRSQVHYYFSEENLSTDEFLRKRMNDEGFVHIEFIAHFNKLKALTDNMQLILDSLQGSDVVELKGCEIRSRYMWKKFLMPVQLRIRFIPSPKYIMASKLEDEMESSSSSQ